MACIGHYRFLYLLLTLACIVDNLSALLKEILVANAAELKLTHLISQNWYTDHSLESFHLIGLFLDNRYNFLDYSILESQFFFRKRFKLGIFLLNGSQSGFITLLLFF